jgi:hypothetical protein
MSSSDQQLFNSPAVQLHTYTASTCLSRILRKNACPLHVPGGGRDKKTADGWSRRRAHILLLRLKGRTQFRYRFVDLDAQQKEPTHFFREDRGMASRGASREGLRV